MSPNHKECDHEPVIASMALITSHNRESWLTELGKQVEPLYKGFNIPGRYRLTCGWPCRKGLGKRSRVIGECHAAESSKAGIHEIFISPLLDQPLEVAGTVCHELAHVAAGIKAAHGKGFVKVCQHVGLTKGKPTHVMPGARLNEKLQQVVERMGEYPHQAIVPVYREVKKQRSTVTVLCSECGCKATMSAKWLTSSGLPTCGCGQPMQLEVRENEE